MVKNTSSNVATGTASPDSLMSARPVSDDVDLSVAEPETLKRVSRISPSAGTTSSGNVLTSASPRTPLEKIDPEPLKFGV